MENNTVNVDSQKYLETMARLMSEALESPDGMRALAAAIAAPIEQEIKRKEISSLLLRRHNLPKGERPSTRKSPRSRPTGSRTKGRPRSRTSARTKSSFPPTGSTRPPWSMSQCSRTATSAA